MHSHRDITPFTLYRVLGVARPSLRESKSSNAQLRIVIAEPTSTCSHSTNEEAVKTGDRIS